MIAQNVARSYILPECRMKQVPSVTIDRFRRISEPRQDAVLPTLKIEDDAQPVPTRALMVRPPVSPPTVYTPSPVPATIVPTPTPPPVVVHKEKESEPEPEPVSERTSTRSMDPITIGIGLRDPMYAIATPAVKQSIQAEEARLLEAKLAELYKSESGRSRGWVKTHLEAFLVPRAANGAQSHGKTVFDWSQLWTDKQVSATLDYICVAKGIRLAVWNDKTHEIGLWPAADSVTPRDGPTPLLHVSAQGGTERPPASMDGWALRAPLSVEHALEKLTLAELESVATNIGLSAASLTGKKADRVRTIASARMALRLR